MNAIDVLTPVVLVDGARRTDVDSLTLATCEDPPSSEARLEDTSGVVLARAYTIPGVKGCGWTVTRAGAERVVAESTGLISFGRAS